ncbi:MAG: monovalent cation/H+ antiporter subunit D family protein [Alphaproteobacteria bacterium]|nr:monovalent cation/H+ antiporter subunit D family protein [Alphaproteobacteria bacterium]
MLTDLPALQVLLPLFTAPLCVIFSRFGKVAWLLSTVAVWLVAAMCITTFFQVYDSKEVLTYHMGGWQPPYGIEYRIDLLSATMLALVSMIGAMVMPYAMRSVNEEIARERQPYFYAAFLLCLSGLLGILSTNDAFNLYVFLEISSLSSYALIAMGRDRRALTAAFQYLMLGTIGATFILIGIGYLYLMTGTLNISDLSTRISGIEDTRPVLVAFAFLAVGLCMKIALYPLHMWLPNAYAYAPSVISAFLAAVATKVGVYAVLRFFYTLFGYEYSFNGMHLALIFTALAIPAMLIGSTVAIFQNNLKRMLAFSSIAQIGYITLGIGLDSTNGLTAAIVHMINHSVIKFTLFLALGCFALRLGSKVNLNSVRGIGKHMPFTSLAFVIGGIALIGVPLTNGFISKWYLLTASLDHGWWLITVVIVICSLLALTYVWRVVEAIYFGTLNEKFDQTIEAPASMVIPLWIMVGVIVWLGVDTRYTVGVAEIIVQNLMPLNLNTTGGGV